jgi:hypothetical protein
MLKVGAGKCGVRGGGVESELAAESKLFDLPAKTIVSVLGYSGVWHAREKLRWTTNVEKDYLCSWLCLVHDVSSFD